MDYPDFKESFAIRLQEQPPPKIITSTNAFPAYAYTFGCAQLYKCEFITFGLPGMWAKLFLLDIKVGLDFGDEIRIDEPNITYSRRFLKFQICDVDKARKYALLAGIGPDVNLIQIVYPDSNGYFPENPAYSHREMDATQPLLYTPYKYEDKA